VRYPAGSAAQSVAIGDFNGDGKPDLAVANTNDGTISVLSGNGDGTFQAAVNYAVGAGAKSVVVGSFKSDGRADLAVTTSAGLAVLLNVPPAPDISVTMTHTGNFTQGQTGATYSTT